jgi:hypothetical protein
MTNMNPSPKQPPIDNAPTSPLALQGWNSNSVLQMQPQIEHANQQENLVVLANLSQ